VNSHQLRVFLMVARHANFSRAADALFLTQSAVSQQIDALEREQNVRLFDRLPRRVTLTDAGVALLPYAERVTQLIDDAVQALDEVRGVTRGRLRVGASPTPATYLLPELLGNFSRDHPGVDVVLDVDISARITDRLADGDLALGVVECLVPDPRITADALVEDELVLVTHLAFAPAGARVSLAEVQTCRYIAREPSSLTRIFVDARLRDLGVELRPAMELGHIEAIKHAVAAGLGMAFLSRAAVEDEVRAGRVRIWTVEGLDLHRPWYLLRRAGARLAPAAVAFVDFLADRLPASAHDPSPIRGQPNARRIPKRTCTG
jgi:DNA-binding transcriptional LysR family regulator